MGTKWTLTDESIARDKLQTKLSLTTLLESLKLCEKGSGKTYNVVKQQPNIYIRHDNDQ